MASQALATQDDAPLVKLGNQLEQRAEQYRKVLPSHITPEKFQRTVITAVQADPVLLTADRQSLMLACMQAAQDGLLPDKREAALVIFNTRAQVNGQWVTKKNVAYMPMVYGLRKKVLQSGEIADITAKVVYRREVDEGFFVYEEGTEAMLRHRPMLELSDEDATDANIVAAYSMATFKDGTKSYEVMRRFEIDKVRECSQTGATRDRKGQKRDPSGPWVDWYPEQAKKTVIRRHTKTLPMSGDLIDVEGMDELTASRSTLSTLALAEPEAPKVVPMPSRNDASEEGEDGTDQPAIDEDEERSIAEELDRETMREGDFDPETGEIDHADAEEQQQAATLPAEPWAEFVDELLSRVLRASILGDVLSAEMDFAKHRDALPATVVKKVEREIVAGKKRFGK